VFDRIDRLGIRCDAEQNGWIQGAVTNQRLHDQHELADEFAEHGLPIQRLERADIARQTGSSRYMGGLFVEQSGSIQPLSYTRELARVAKDLGVSVYTHSAVQTLRRLPGNKGWVVSTGVGQEPLSNELQRKILPNRSTLVDKRRMILYGRYDRDGRLTMGDHGPMRDAFCLDDFTDVKKRAIEVFPELEGVRWDYHWGGRIAITKDELPFLFAPTADLFVGMGYNGRGVGMGTMMGLAMAARVLGHDVDKAFMPVTVPNEFVFHRFHRIGAEVLIRWEMFMDHLEDSRA